MVSYDSDRCLLGLAGFHVLQVGAGGVGKKAVGSEQLVVGVICLLAT